MSVATTGGKAGKRFQHGNSWQYHSRSDRHSKIACWALMFDLLKRSDLLRAHAASGKIAIGINHLMRDFARNRAKDLDLVVCLTEPGATTKRDFADLVDDYVIVLTDTEQRQLAALPRAPLAVPSTVLVALEAKACMTEFIKARPRLYDELNSSHLTIHGDTNGAIAAGFVLINTAETFVSPIRNPWSLAEHEAVVSTHRQPQEMRSMAAKVAELPRRSSTGEAGFDAIAIGVIDCANDGRPVTVKTEAPGADFPAIFGYDLTIGRLAQLYATRFASV